VWLLYAQFEIRQKALKAARQALVWISPSIFGRPIMEHIVIKSEVCILEKESLNMR